MLKSQVLIILNSELLIILCPIPLRKLHTRKNIHELNERNKESKFILEISEVRIYFYEIQVDVLMGYFH